MAAPNLNEDALIDVVGLDGQARIPGPGIEGLSPVAVTGRSISKVSWKDITEPFRNACKELKLGELLHDANFSLVEGMSAIEMMDPKMDAGMSCNLAKHKVLSFQQAIQEKILKASNFGMDELIGIIDDSLSCLVTWLEGHSLVQTVFINLYLHDPTLVEDPTLRAFGVCLLKIIDVVRYQINWAGVYEEEDFQSMVHNFRLAQEVTEAAALSAMKEAEEEYAKVAKNTRARSGVVRDENEVAKHNLATGLNARLKFVRLLYATIVSFNKEKGSGVPDAERHLKNLSELLVQVKSSVDLGSFKPRDDHQGNADERQFAEGFDPMANQRLLPPTFPRFVTINSRLESVCYLEKFVSRLQHITSVVSLTNFHDILDFCLDFSKSSPCLLSRSILQIVILPLNKKFFGREVVTDFVKETIRSFCCPPPFVQKCPLYSNQQVKEFVDAFLVHSARPIVSMIQITGHNRARQRDKWVRQLEELGALQDEAEKIDSFIHALMLKSDPNWKLCLNFGTWVLYLVLRVMTLYVVSGLELELYATYEYSYIFWYLSEGMYNWMISTIKRAEAFHQDGEAFSITQGAKGTKKAKNKKKKSRVQGNELAVAQALHSLTGGFYKAVIGLRMDNKLRLPKFDFDCEEVRYNHRFTPFAYVATPPMFHYGQFKDHTDTAHCSPPIQPADLYGSACRCFDFAKKELELIPNPTEEVKALLKVAKTNLIVMRILQGGHKKDSKTPPEFSFEAHSYYPIIKLS